MALPTMPILPISPASAAKKPKARSAVAGRIVSLARRELAKGVREVPDGSNRAPAIRRYETATRGAMFGAPWCAYFVSYIANHAGAPIGPGGAGMGYVPYIRAWAKQTRRWKATPRAGDLITFPQHVGIVENVYANHTLTTIEGNAGNAVRRRWRRWGEATGYVRVANGAPAPAPAPAPKRPTAPKPPKKAPAEKLVPRITAYPGLKVATGQTISFTSNDSTGDIVRSAWDLDGNGKYDASGDSVDKRYVKPGTYKVGLRVTDRAKHTATTSVMVTVKSDHPPVALLDVSATTLTVGDTLTGDASRSYDPEGKIARYEWDLNGDGNYSEDGKKHSSTFEEPGDYNVGLRVIDEDGNEAETHVAIHVNDLPAPVARINCDSTTIAAKKSLRCRADTSASPVKLTRLDWDTDGDGAYDRSGSEVRVTFSKAGERTLRLRVADARGRVGESRVTIAVANNLPSASISAPSTVGLGARAAFDGLKSTDSDGVIASWEWDLDGDGTYENAGPQPSFVYPAPGTYTVRLRVTDDNGGQATASTTVRVTNSAPTARITLPSPARVNTDLTFDGTTSSDADGTVSQYEWDLDGNGTYETTGAKPVKRYTTTGTRTIRLRVTDEFGATATTSRSLTVTA